jgi:hypothetical protein
MKKSELKQIIREEIQNILENQPMPQRAPERERERRPEPGILEPGTAPEPKPKRRTLAPPKESPNTRPKASVKESEKDLINKIAKRFKNLSK